MRTPRACVYSYDMLYWLQEERQGMGMKAQEYADRLNRLYEACYNGTEAHTCAHWNECRLLEKGDLAPTDTVKFYYDRVKVGEAYDTQYPRVLFCGLEGGHSGKENHRIPPVCLDRESSRPSCDAINNHYRGVRYTLS